MMFNMELEAAKTPDDCWALCTDFGKNSRKALAKMLGMINDQKEMGSLIYRFMTEWAFTAGQGQEFLDMLTARVNELPE